LLDTPLLLATVMEATQDHRLEKDESPPWDPQKQTNKMNNQSTPPLLTQHLPYPPTPTKRTPNKLKLNNS